MSNLKKYVPSSSGTTLNVFLPESMAFEMGESLNRISKQYGDIDDFVAGRLHYSDKEELYKYLAAEQIDGVALAIHNIEKGYGIIIGDQTGIGKGRQAAAIVRYGVMNGYNTIFVTEKSTLFTDLYRDLRDIDADDFVPYIFNSDTEGNIKDENGELYAKIKKNQKYRVKNTNKVESDLQAALEESNGKKLPKGYDFVALTYSQVQGDSIAKKAQEAARGISNPKGKNGKQGKTEFLREYAKNGIFILDESHNAGGSESIIGFYFRELLRTAKGCCYLSATFAKRPDNMPVYGIKTSLSDTNLKDEDLQKVFEAGGLALQEVAASELVKAGQMVRRQRSFDGIEFKWNVLAHLGERHWKMVDKVTEIMRDISEFQADYIKPFVERVNETMYDDSTAEERKGVKNFGANNTDYFSKAHNVIYQLMFSLKAEAVAKRAIELLNEDKKVVIAFSSTMGSFLNDMGLADGEVIDRLDFAEILKKGLEGVFIYHQRKFRKKSEKHYIDLADLSGSGQNAYHHIVEKIDAVSTGLSMSPIDILTNIIESTKRPKGLGGQDADYYRVRECTGRSAQIRFENGVPTYRKFKAKKEQFFREFNSGAADVLLINQTAATGVSAHSSKSFADQRQRCMLLHQPELNINTEVQKLGRINRTGQVNLPYFEYLTSTVPSEKRQFMILKAKLKSLDANTTGNQKNSNEQLDLVDFMNKYGGKVIFNHLKDNPILNDELGDPCYKESRNWEGEVTRERLDFIDIPRRATNRAQLLPVDKQKIFYDGILEKYKNYVAHLKETGKYDLEVEYLDFQADIKKRYLYNEGSGKSSPFGRDAVLDVNIAKILKKPFNRARIKEVVEKKLKKRTADEHMRVITDQFEREYPKIIEKQLKNHREKTEEMEENLEVAEIELAKMPTEGNNEKETEKLLKKYNRKKKAIERLEQKIDAHRDSLMERESKLRAAQENLSDYFKVLKIGNVVSLPMSEDGTQYVMNGVVIDLRIGWKNENPFIPSNIVAKIAVNNNKVIVERVLSSPISYQMLNASKNLTDQYKQHVLNNWDKKLKTNEKEAVFTATGNVFRAMAKAHQQLNVPRLFKYTLSDGSKKNGIILGRADSAKEVDIQDWMEQERNRKFFNASIGLGSVYDTIRNLSYGNKVEIVPDKITIQKEEDDSYYLVIHPKGNKPILANKDILKLVEKTSVEIANNQEHGNFRTYTAALMYAEFIGENIIEALKILESQHDITMTESKPREIPIQDEAETIDGRFQYKLTKAYIASDYPTKNMLEFMPPLDSGYGFIYYRQPLTVRQRFETGLIPVFNSIAEPFQVWKAELSDTDKTRIKTAITNFEDAPYHSVINHLGLLLIEIGGNAGNREFIFGEYPPKSFGKLVYKDWIGNITPMHEMAMFEEMLQFEMG